MKHAIDESTRAIVRGIITTIRSRHNCTRAEAERLFRRNIATCDVTFAIFEAVDNDIQEQKDMDENT